MIGWHGDPVDVRGRRRYLRRVPQHRRRGHDAVHAAMERYRRSCNRWLPWQSYLRSSTTATRVGAWRLLSLGVVAYRGRKAIIPVMKSPNPAAVAVNVAATEPDKV